MEAKKPSNFREFFQQHFLGENNDNVWDFLNQKSPMLTSECIIYTKHVNPLSILLYVLFVFLLVLN